MTVVPGLLSLGALRLWGNRDGSFALRLSRLLVVIARGTAPWQSRKTDKIRRINPRYFLKKGSNARDEVTYAVVWQMTRFPRRCISVSLSPEKKKAIKKLKAGVLEISSQVWLHGSFGKPYYITHSTPAMHSVGYNDALHRNTTIGYRCIRIACEEAFLKPRTRIPTDSCLL